MSKLYEKNELLFALVCIVIYVLGFGNADMLSQAMGMPKLLTTVFGAAMSAVMFLFVKKNGLMQRFGLCRSSARSRQMLWYLPLVLISGVNLWCGLTAAPSKAEAALHILSMLSVAFLEELIFRGFLFKAMCCDNVTAAIIVSSLTFGMGHAVNLLMGAPLFETLLQLCYASAVGFCYTAVFLAGGSILPCIASHAAVNCMSIFAQQPSAALQTVFAAAQTLIGVCYGAWLLRGHNQNKTV